MMRQTLGRRLFALLTLLVTIVFILWLLLAWPVEWGFWADEGQQEVQTSETGAK